MREGVRALNGASVSCGTCGAMAWEPCHDESEREVVSCVDRMRREQDVRRVAMQGSRPQAAVAIGEDEAFRNTTAALWQAGIDPTAVARDGVRPDYLVVFVRSAAGYVVVGRRDDNLLPVATPQVAFLPWMCEESRRIAVLRAYAEESAGAPVSAT